MDAANNKTSHLVATQLPEFIRRDHPKFIEFLENYYKFLEQDGEMLYVAKRLGEFYDIDNINEDIQSDILQGHNEEDDGYHILRQKFYDNFLTGFPNNSQFDKTIIAKHGKDFFRSTGTEKSFRFGMRSLYDKETSFYYPKDNILKASDGKWYVQKSLNIRDIAVDGIANTDALIRFANTTIRGAISNSTCTVESVNPYFQSGVLITELIISAVEQDFTNGESLSTTIEDEGVFKTLSANLYSGIIVRTTVTEPGSGYIQGAVVPVVAANGQGAVIIISKVAKAKLEGKIKAVTVVLQGAGYQANTPLLFTGGGGQDAAANISVVDVSETYHPSSYSIIASTINLEANTFLLNAVGNIVATQAYTNLATQWSNTSNLNISTISGGLINDITLSKNLANSNVYFETGDVIFCQNTYQVVTTTNKYYFEISVQPGLSGNLANVSFTVYKKPNVNSTIENSMDYWTYGNCGPVIAVAIIDPGKNYISIPAVTALPNTFIRSLGILGRLEIYAGGVGYANGDIIQFTNPPGTYGIGGNAQVSLVSANGMIEQVSWFAIPGHLLGGSGYRQDMLPTVSIITANGTNANVMVTACLADGSLLEAKSNVIGSISELKIVSGGFGYEEPPILDLSTQGDGTALAFANIVTGLYTYPGRYIDQDGQLSSYNFLENRDYYQKFSYVVKVEESMDKYRTSLNNLIHPAGMKMFGEYQFADNNETSMNTVNVINTQITVSVI